jgi:lipopolysaccharide export system protein LptA
LTGRIVLNGQNVTFVPATPVTVQRVQVQGKQVHISTPVESVITQRVITATTRPQTTVKITASGNRVQIQTPTMRATCDQVSSLPNGQVILEGNVTVCSAELKAQAQRLIVDLNTNEFKVPQNNTPTTPAHRVGLFYAPSPIPMFFPPAPPIPPMPTIAYPVPMPHPVPAPTPVSRPISPTGFTPSGYYQTVPNPSPR